MELFVCSSMQSSCVTVCMGSAGAGAVFGGACGERTPQSLGEAYGQRKPASSAKLADCIPREHAYLHFGRPLVTLIQFASRRFASPPRRDGKPPPPLAHVSLRGVPQFGKG